ncbi:MAG TPA: imidazole glycerol phosphate synthase subunit HisH [Kofleriaceae bacterium]|nr:imidazole glycerol phosphate synthase subunit HisH [Kofleriaceae bacterium]
MAIVVVDYDMGNVGSIVNMLKKIGHAAELSSVPDVIRKADRLILPGVGSFDAGMDNIRKRGLVEVLHEKVVVDKTPVLGICLGMQLLGEGSHEGTSRGLGWIPAESVKLSSESLRVPHMGWNELNVTQPHWLFEGEPADMRFYFVHSYHVVCKDPQHQLATARYGIDLSAAIARDHILGVQFHPEKSHRFGMQLLKNFASHTFC